jgi:peptidoglycan/LPS O-acetylase OafA/YrhL
MPNAKPADSVRSRFDPRNNAITPMRLALALLVVFSHAYPAGGFGPDPLQAATGQMELGTVAVIAFFGLSGFLLVRSRSVSTLQTYARNRLLRLVPGLWVCLAVHALIFIPIAVALGGRASSAEVSRYVIAIGSFQLAPLAIGGLYPGSGSPSLVNPSLWTLAPEFYCYIVLGLLGLRLIVLRLATLELLVAFVLLNAWTGGTSLYLHLPVAFLTGMALWVYGDRVLATTAAAAAILAVTCLASGAGVLGVIAPVTLPYLAVWLATRLPVRWSFDLSYGVYIYAWPIQALLAEAGVTRLGFLPYLATCVLFIVPVAALSARLIEMPALRLRAARRPPALVPQAAS